MTVLAPEPAAPAAPSGARERLLRYAFMRLTRDLDSRLEALLLTGRVSKWYSEVGNEATTVPAGLVLGPGDALCSLHRDLGAILAVFWVTMSFSGHTLVRFYQDQIIPIVIGR